MSLKYITIVFAVCIAIVLSSCKKYNTNLSVSHHEMPQAFHGATDSSSVEQMNWKSYFNDPHLVNLIDTALKNNFDLHIALQKIEIARSYAKSAKGALLPQVGLNLGGGIRKFGLYTMDGAGNISTFITPGQIVPVDLPDMYVGLQASWEIDIWGKLRNQRKAAVSQYLSSIEGTNFVISNLVTDIAISYYELLALDNELEIIKQTIQQQQEVLEVIKQQKERGRANELAVQQFSSNLLSSQILEKETLLQLTLVENRINFLLGKYPQKIDRNKEVLRDSISQQFVTGIPSNLLQNRPDIREATFLVQASKFDLKSAKAAFYPNLNITAGIGYQAFNPEYLFLSPVSMGYSALGNIIAPLINRSALKAKFTSAKASQLTAMYTYQKTVLNGFTEVSNELSNIKNLTEIQVLKKQQATLLNLSVETSKDLYLSGRASYLEVLFTQQRALQTQLELIQTNRNQRIATVKIYKALGGGWR